MATFYRKKNNSYVFKIEAEKTGFLEYRVDVLANKFFRESIEFQLIGKVIKRISRALVINALLRTDKKVTWELSGEYSVDEFKEYGFEGEYKLNRLNELDIFSKKYRNIQRRVEFRGYLKNREIFRQDFKMYGDRFNRLENINLLTGDKKVFLKKNMILDGKKDIQKLIYALLTEID